MLYITIYIIYKSYCKSLIINYKCTLHYTYSREIEWNSESGVPSISLSSFLSLAGRTQLHRVVYVISLTDFIYFNCISKRI